MTVDTFRDKLISQKTCTILPGVYDSLTTMLTAQAGFDACVITGYSASATLLGKPDLGIMTQSELLDLTRRICWNSDL